MQEKNFVHKEFIEWEEKINLYSVKYNNELVGHSSGWILDFGLSKKK